MYDDDDFYYAAAANSTNNEPKTLSEWVKNFRLKKLQMKRRLRAGNSNLRVCAILSTALLSAENQLRVKQQQRLNRCLQLQSKFHQKLIGTNFQQMQQQTTFQQQQQHNDAAQRQQQQQYVYSTTTTINQGNFHATEIVDKKQQQNVTEAEIKRRIQISNLWREELNGLDNLLRKTSSSSNNNNNCGSISSNFHSVGSGNSGNGSCAEAANQRFFENDEKNMLTSIAVSS